MSFHSMLCPSFVIILLHLRCNMTKADILSFFFMMISCGLDVCLWFIGSTMNWCNHPPPEDTLPTWGRYACCCTTVHLVLRLCTRIWVLWSFRYEFYWFFINERKYDLKAEKLLENYTSKLISLFVVDITEIAFLHISFN